MNTHLQSVKARLRWLYAATIAVIPWVLDQIVGDVFVNWLKRSAGHPAITKLLASLLLWATLNPFQAFLGSSLLMLVAISSAAYIYPLRTAKVAKRPDVAFETFWPVTGDDQLDVIHAKLNRLHESGMLREADLAAILREHFFRAGFRHIAEEGVARMLFLLCRTRLLLQRYVADFKSSAAVRDRIVHATTRVIKLEQYLERLVGRTFVAVEHCEKYRNSRHEFIDKLPKRDIVLRRRQIEEANTILADLLGNLRAAGIAD